MHLYRFDQIDEQLQLVPMAARRALDCAGLKLSLEQWQGLDVVRRRQLAELGSGLQVDTSAVRSALGQQLAAAEPIEPPAEPDALRVPDAVAAAYGRERPIPDATWSALLPLDRYTLAKVAARGRPERLQGAYAEIVGLSAQSTHLGPSGDVRMVGVADKPATRRTAAAQSCVRLNADAFQRLLAADAPKGDVLATARLAGIMAAKKTSDLIPLCHPLALTRVQLELKPVAASGQAAAHVAICARVETLGRTGVEMEALTAASVAALTVYDMLKAFDRAMQIGPTQLIEKTGGRSGDYRA